MPAWFASFVNSVVLFLPNLLIALAILVVGWIVAYLLSKLVENLLHRTDLDNRLAGSLRGGKPNRIPIEHWIALIVFWLIMLFVIVLFLGQLNLAVISAPLNTLVQQFVGYLPNLLGALLLIALAWVIATVLRAVIVRVVGSSSLTRRVSESADVQTNEGQQRSIGVTIGNVVYWLVFLLFLPAIIGALKLQGLLAPVTSMVNGVLSYLPKVLGAALVLVVGYLIARVARQIVTNLLASAGVDRVARGAEPQPIPATGAATTSSTEPSSTTRGMSLSALIGTIVFVLILVPVVIAALNVLNIPAVSGPAATMLTNFLNALPRIFAAFLLLAIAFYLGRIIGKFVAGLLANLGFDGWFRFLGLPESNVHRTPRQATDEAARTATSTTEVAPGRVTPSEVVGYIVTVGIILFAAMEASTLLGFGILATMISAFITQLVNILFGLIIFGVGLFLANQAARAIRGMDMNQSNVLAAAARIAIIIFSAALALRQMGIAPSIVNLAFGLMLGAVAVATAIAFGIGGRDAARNIVNNWQREGLPIPTTGGSGSGSKDREQSDAGPAGAGATDQGSTNPGSTDLGPTGSGSTGTYPYTGSSDLTDTTPDDENTPSI